MRNRMESKVYFMGAGPGDPDLLTLKGDRLLRSAGMVVYTGSLINPKILQSLSKNCERIDSASLTLPEIVDALERGVTDNPYQKVVRLHTGDPSIYSAMQEQIDILSQRGIASEIIPGVSSFQAASAALQNEYTLPGVSQSLIITRIAGRTPVPETESLKILSKTKASMAIFLSTGHIDEVVSSLLSGGYTLKTPAAVVYKASWPEQQIIEGTLKTIAEQVHEAEIENTALILVGEFLNKKYDHSKLYDAAFSHACREKE